MHKPLAKGLPLSPYRQSFRESLAVFYGNRGWFFYALVAFIVLGTVAGIIALILLPKPPLN